MARNKRKRVDRNHLERIAEALDIDEMNDIIAIENVEDEERTE